LESSFLFIAGLGAFILSYYFYGEHLSKNIFSLSKLDEKDLKTPAYEFEDGVDYVPANKSILFGHHFSSIAGAAPIVGPAVAAIWGWLPAFLWIVFGVVFMGAAHDFGVLVLSMQNKGKSIAHVCEDLLGPKVKNLFLIVIFFLVWMVIAVFALVIANLFISFPSSVIPVNFEIFIAITIGIVAKKSKWSLTVPSILAQLMLMLMIYIGTIYPVDISGLVGSSNVLMAWMIFLLVYSFIASILPVWLLLQPRDYINCHQLFLGLGLMSLGVLIVSPDVVAPALNLNPKGAPPWFPFLFITIACGAISGFHGLVSGGTTSKQVKKFKDAKPIGYGSMLGEGLLALLATLAVCTGFSDSGHWHDHYSSWSAANGLTAKINAFVLGAGGFLSGLGIPENISQTVIAVLIISFAATSLDTACRIQRYIISELGESFSIKPLKNRFLSGGLAVGTAFLLMISGDQGKGGLSLWPLFGATNQMLACLSLIVISVWLKKRGKNSLYFLVPALIILIVTSIALTFNLFKFFEAENYFLTIISLILLVIEFFIASLSVKIFRS
jgi:carbon starvation protein